MYKLKKISAFLLCFGIIAYTGCGQVSTDGAGNPGNTGDSDVTPPVISAVQVTDLQPDSATIIWNTDEPATSRVEYGFDTGYGQTPLDDTSLSNSHTAELYGLIENTLYYYRITSADAAGNESIVENTFLTPAINSDTTPPVITLLGSATVSVQVGSVYSDAGATASDDVDGDLTGSIITVSTVDTNTVGIYSVTYDVSDAAGNSAAQVTRTVNVVDTTAPMITNVQATGIQQGSATIIWNTDEPATSRVEYGFDTGYGLTTTLDASLVTSHSVLVSSLSASTLYHYRVINRDALGNEATGADFTFTTIGSGGSNSTILSWDANVEADLAGYIVYYGTTSGIYGTQIDVGNVTTYTVEGLTWPNTYYFAVKAYDTSANFSDFSTEVAKYTP